MDQIESFDAKEVLTHIVGDMARALSERSRETGEQRFYRFQAAIRMIMEFGPRGVVEAMLSSRCVMFHELLVDGVAEALRGDMDKPGLATRGNIVALDKCFGDNLKRLEMYQWRRLASVADRAEAARDVDAPIAARTAPPEAAATNTEAWTGADTWTDAEAWTDAAAWTDAEARPDEAFLAAAAQPGGRFDRSSGS